MKTIYHNEKDDGEGYQLEDALFRKAALRSSVDFSFTTRCLLSGKLLYKTVPAESNPHRQ